jgi:hypothetical protein
MKTLLVPVVLVLSGNAFAQACWVEWDLRGETVLRANTCTEKIAIPDGVRTLCKPVVETDQVRQAQSCPATARVRDGARAVTAPIVARCNDIRPPNSGGKADLIYYGGKDFAESKESLQSLCEGFEGKWIESRK